MSVEEGFTGRVVEDCLELQHQLHVAGFLLPCCEEHGHCPAVLELHCSQPHLVILWLSSTAMLCAKD